MAAVVAAMAAGLGIFLVRRRRKQRREEAEKGSEMEGRPSDRPFYSEGVSSWGGVGEQLPACVAMCLRDVGFGPGKSEGGGVGFCADCVNEGDRKRECVYLCACQACACV